MTAIRNKSIGITEYYESFRKNTELKLERTKIAYDELVNVISERRSAIVPNLDKFRLPIVDYPEFQQNKYINGRLEDAAKSMYQDNDLDITDKHLHFKLVSYAVSLRKIKQYVEDINKYERMLKVDFKTYRDFIRQFYEEVQRQMIINGYGYRLEGKLGWICINRVLNTGKRVVDFEATRLNKAKLIAEGKQIYDKEQAEWCKENDIEYDAVKATVFKQDVAWYEFALIGCTLPNKQDIKFTPTDTVSKITRNYNQEELIKLCNEDKEKICKLDLSCKRKLTLCLKADKLLYSKFIRNENQTKSNFEAHRWKSR